MSLNILIVDDSDTVRAVIKKSLKMSGVPVDEILEAENGIDGLTVLAASHIDLVLTDINMPEMNGVEMITKMKEDEKLKSLPIVVISTEGSKTRIEELKEAGIRDYLRKPFTPESLKNVLKEITGE